MAYYLKDLPFTEEGKKLNLSDEDRKRFRMVYKKQGEDWILHDIWGEGGEYGDDCIVVPLESTYRQCVDFQANWIFANVEGSQYDRIPVEGGISWIAFWRTMYLAKKGTRPPKECCTDGYIYKNENNMDYIIRQCSCFYGNANIELDGGHVIGGKEAVFPEIGDIVYIVPICREHNSSRSVGYMKTKAQTFAVELLYKITIRSFLEQHPLETHEKI